MPKHAEGTLLERIEGEEMIDLDKLEASCTRNSDLPPRFSAIKALELIAEVRKYKSALEFYADQANYDVAHGSVHDFVPKGMNSPRKLWKVLDMGERARQALTTEETK